MVSHFRRLLRKGDTYATWAAMRVPANTPQKFVPSEQLAYLVERVANDAHARPGGEQGYALGQSCLANLRTWLFRTPLCRWLDEINALDDFTLRPADMAALAREAVDFFAKQQQPDLATPALNEWTERLDSEQLEQLYSASPLERNRRLAAMSPEQLAGYLFALATTKASGIASTIDHYSAMLAEMTTGEHGSDLQVIAGEVLAMGLAMEAQDQVRAQLQRNGFAMWMDGTADASTAKLMFLTPDPGKPGSWRLNHYRRDVGAFHSDELASADQALQLVGASTFSVPDDEAPAVLQEWGQPRLPLTARQDQLQSKAFRDWFSGSKAAYADGRPMLLFHGTGGKDFSVFNGFTTWASTTPQLAEQYAFYRAGESADSAAQIMPVYLKANTPFDADTFSKEALTVGRFFNEVARQAKVLGHVFDVEQARVMLNHIKACAKREESGPYYVAHDIWNQPASLFGKDGASTIRALFEHMGFDSIRVTEGGHLTYGVFDATQVKSAIGNVGTFSASIRDIRFTFAGQRAAGANLNTLKEARERLEQQDDPEAVRKETGWHLGVDGKWRFEIDDSASKLLPMATLVKSRAFANDRVTSVNYREGGGLWRVSIVTEKMRTVVDIIVLENINPNDLRLILDDATVDAMLAGEGEDQDYDEDLGILPSKSLTPDNLHLWLPRDVKVQYVLDHPALYAAYPELADVRVLYAPEIVDLGAALGQSIDTGEAVLILGKGDNSRRVVLHELQHYVQAAEGFANGGSSSDFEDDQQPSAVAVQILERLRVLNETNPRFAWANCKANRLHIRLADQYGQNDAITDWQVVPEADRKAYFAALKEAQSFAEFDEAAELNAQLNRLYEEHGKPLTAMEKYHRLAGEVEARATEARADFDAEVRRLMPPAANHDVRPEDQIVVWNGIEMPGASRQALRYTFAGPRSATAIRAALEEARQRHALGDDAEAIRQATGWHQGHEGKWRYEIDDSAMAAKDNWGLWGQNKAAHTYRLGELVEHWALFDAYPHLRYTRVTLDPEMEPGSGRFNVRDNSISLYAEQEDGKLTLSEGQMSVLLHEIQHVLQAFEGFAPGGNPAHFESTPFPELAQRLQEIIELDELARKNDTTPQHFAETLRYVYSADFIERVNHWCDSGQWDSIVGMAKEHMIPSRVRYKQLAGEVEARNVQARQSMTTEERRAIPPQATEDTPAGEVRLQNVARSMLNAPEASPAPALPTSQREPLLTAAAASAKFGEMFHGTARPFDAFDMAKLGRNGGGYNHQGRGIYLTNDPTGLARFFANTAAFKTAQRELHVDQTLTEAEAEALEESGGVVLRVQLAGDTKLLDLREPGADAEVLGLFSRSVGDYDVAEALKIHVLALGYDGIVFAEPNAPEGWEISPNPVTVVLYRADAAKIVGHFPASGPVPVSNTFDPDVRYSFSTGAVGTGEAAAVYGWGLYFARQREVADYYRSRTTNPVMKLQVRYQDVKVENSNTPAVSADPVVCEVLGDIIGANGDYAEARKVTQARLDALTADEQVAWLNEDAIVQTRAALARYDEIIADLEIDHQPSHLYSASIPDEHEYLVWDKPLHEQSAHVREALARAGMGYDSDLAGAWLAHRFDQRQLEEQMAARASDDAMYWDLFERYLKLQASAGAEEAFRQASMTGAELYEQLRLKLDGEGGTGQEASKYLASLGIAGNKYLDANSRDGDSASATYNYVVFNADATQVLERTMFQGGHDEVIAVWNGIELGPLPLEEANRKGAFARWFGSSQAVDGSGQPLRLYHGTAADFTAFAPDFHRTVLNDKYQGDGFHFSASPETASEYADASRNQLFNKACLFEVVDAVIPPRIAKVFKEIVEEGFEPAWDKYTGEEVGELIREAESAGLDINDLTDLAPYVEGNRYEAGRTPNGLDSEPLALFGASRHYMPEYIRDIAVRLGLESALPNPVVMPVYLKIDNLLRTDDPEAAKRAQDDGYDGVYYYGPGTVNDEPEWVVFRPEQIKSAIGNVGTFDSANPDIRFSLINSQATPTQTETPEFQSWFRKSQVVGVDGMPLVVYHGSPERDAQAAFGAQGNRVARIADGAPFFITDNHAYAADFARGGRVEALYARLENPADLYDQEMLDRLLEIYNADQTRSPWDEMMDGEIAESAYFLLESPDVMAYLRAEGFDGAIIPEDIAQDVTSWAVFSPEQIKSAIDNIGTFDSANPDIRFSFAGEQARTASREALADARLRIEQGEDAETVRQLTGWFEGRDGKWRFEIDDSAARIRGYNPETDEEEVTSTNPVYVDWIEEAKSRENGIPLAQALHHPALFAAYPALKGLRLFVANRLPNFASAYFMPDERGITHCSITLADPYEDGAKDKGLSALLHEIQHGLQTIEGFALGASPDNEDLPTSRSILRAVNKDYREQINAIRQSEAYQALVQEELARMAPEDRYFERGGRLIDRGPAQAEAIADAQMMVDALEDTRLAKFDRLCGLLGPLQHDLDKRFLAYKLVYGEVEARNVQARQGLTEAERLTTPPEATEDVPGDAVIVWNGIEIDAMRLIPQRQRQTDTPEFKAWFQIKSAEGNTGAFDPANPDIRFSFAGEQASTAPHQALADARLRIEQGEDAEAVRQLTGWFQGTDGKWRFEIDDSNARLLFHDAKSLREATGKSADYGLGQRATVSDVLNHPALFAAYPALRDVELMFTGDIGRASASYNTLTNTIKVAQGGSDELILSSILHELQHVIQRLEGFAKGSMPENMQDMLNDHEFEQLEKQHDELMSSERAQYIIRRLAELGADWGASDTIPEEVIAEAQALKNDPVSLELARLQKLGDQMLTQKIKFGGKARTEQELMDGYQRLAGEVEARNVQARQGMSAEERLATPPQATADTPPADQIIVWNGTEMASVPGALRQLPAKTMHPTIVKLDAAGDQPSVADDAAKWHFKTEAYRRTHDVLLHEQPFGDLTLKFYAGVPPYNDGQILAINAQDEVVGSLFICQDTDSLKGAVEVRKDRRREGIATAMYDLGEQLLGQRFTPDLPHTPRAEAFWKDRFARQAAGASTLAEAAARSLKSEAEAFKRWFGASHLVGRDGKPLVLYHGTDRDIEHGVFRAGGGMLGQGIYFTGLPNRASFFSRMAANRNGGNRYIVPVYLSIQNPLVFETAQDLPANKIDTEHLAAQGYDGIIIRKSVASAPDSDTPFEVLVFRPEQVKSALSNSGAYGASTPDFRFSLVPQTETPAFKAWFGDSKVVGESGQPLEVYHATAVDIDAFDVNRINRHHVGFHVGSRLSAEAVIENGPEGGNVMPLYVSIQNPLRVVDPGRWTWRTIESAWLKSDGTPANGVEISQDMARDLAEMVEHRFGGGKESPLIAWAERYGYDGFVYDNVYEGGGDSYVAFRAEQIKSAIGNRGTFDPTNPDIRFHLTDPAEQLAPEDTEQPVQQPAMDIRSTDATFAPENSASSNLLFSLAEAPQSASFDDWFAGSQVVDANGKPLVVFRGEHGRQNSDAVAVFQSRLGSLSFGDYATAYLYAAQPNNVNDTLVAPRITPAYLAIKNPVINTTDPFIDFAVLIEVVGMDKARQIAIELEDAVTDTQAWLDQDTDLSVEEYLAQHPQVLNQLYIQAHLVFDNHQYVDWLKQAGFDGTIHGGWGTNTEQPEYKVFDPAQVLSGSPMPALGPEMLPGITMALSSQPRLHTTFEGSPISGRQFAQEGQGASEALDARQGHGLLLSGSALRQHLEGQRASFYAGQRLTPARLSQITAEAGTPSALRAFLKAHKGAIIAGEDIEQRLQQHMRQRQHQLAQVEADYAAAMRGKHRSLSPAVYELQASQIQAELGWLINNMQTFSFGAVAEPGDDFLLWDRPLTEQSTAVREALALIGLDGYFEVRASGQQDSFLSRMEAEHHLCKVNGSGLRASLVSSFPEGYPLIPSGQSLYQYLSSIVGGAEQASWLLASAGIRGIQHAGADDKASCILFAADASIAQTPARGLAAQPGKDKPIMQQALREVPGLTRKGDPASVRQHLLDAAQQARKEAQARVALLEEREHWLKTLHSAQPELGERNTKALKEARAQVQRFNAWRAPSKHNCLSWQEPLSGEVITRLQKLLPIRQDELLTGQAVFQLLACRLGGNKQACKALGEIGIVGAYDLEQTVLWDRNSELLAQVGEGSQALSRFHLAYHGTPHKVDRFSMDKIGTGEGAQAYGWGLYFADLKLVAAHYQMMSTREGHWFDSQRFSHPMDLADEIAPRVAAQHPDLAGELQGVNELEAALRHAIQTKAFSSYALDSVLERMPEAVRVVVEDTLKGVLRIPQNHIHGFFVMPKDGARSLNEIFCHEDEDFSLGLHEIESRLHWKLRSDMNDAEMAQAFAEHVAECINTEASEAVLREVEEDLARNPTDEYLQSRLRDCQYFLRTAQCAAKFVAEYGPLTVHRPLGLGNLYMVDIDIEPEQYLYHGKKFSEQSAIVQQSLLSIVESDRISRHAKATLNNLILCDSLGENFYDSLSTISASPAAECSKADFEAMDRFAATQLLLEAGILGIRYLDGASRQGSQGSYNHVVFDDSKISIIGATTKKITSEDDEILLFSAPARNGECLSMH